MRFNRSFSSYILYYYNNVGTINLVQLYKWQIRHLKWYTTYTPIIGINTTVADFSWSLPSSIQLYFNNNFY